MYQKLKYIHQQYFCNGHHSLDTCLVWSSFWRLWHHCILAQILASSLPLHGWPMPHKYRTITGRFTQAIKSTVLTVFILEHNWEQISHAVHTLVNFTEDIRLGKLVNFYDCTNIKWHKKHLVFRIRNYLNLNDCKEV